MHDIQKAVLSSTQPQKICDYELKDMARRRTCEAKRIRLEDGGLVLRILQHFRAGSGDRCGLSAAGSGIVQLGRFHCQASNQPRRIVLGHGSQRGDALGVRQGDVLKGRSCLHNNSVVSQREVGLIKGPKVHAG